MPVTVRIHPEKPLPSREIIARLSVLGTSLLSDVQDRWPGMPGLLPIGGSLHGKSMVGTAFTVRTRPGDNLVVHAALEIVRPGEVIVVAAAGATDRAIVGGIMTTYAAKRGAAGVVIDGAVRDLSHIGKHGAPTFAKAVSHLGPYRSGPGELRGTISVAGVVVSDGDYIVGDEDGVAVIPRAVVEDVLAAAEAKAKVEEQELRDIAAGTWDRSWVGQSVELKPVSV